MDLPLRSVARPETLAEAVAILAANPASLPVAGGTDMVVQLRDGRRRPELLVDLGRLGMDRITIGREGVEIGAGARMAAIARDSGVRAVCPSLAQAAGLVGAWPIQCRATLGGNLANASPAADTAPPLLVAEAALTIVAPGGTRRLAIDELFRGPGTTTLERGELIAAVHLRSSPAPPGGRVVERFFKVGPRPEQVISVVSLAGRAVVVDGIVEEVRLALGSVAPTPMRARRCESLLRGRRLDQGLRWAACQQLAEEIAPIDDVRAPAWYRRVAAAVVLDRFLQEVESA